MERYHRQAMACGIAGGFRAEEGSVGGEGAQAPHATTGRPMGPRYVVDGGWDRSRPLGIIP